MGPHVTQYFDVITLDRGRVKGEGKGWIEGGKGGRMTVLLWEDSLTYFGSWNSLPDIFIPSRVLQDRFVSHQNKPSTAMCAFFAPLNKGI